MSVLSPESAKVSASGRPTCPPPPLTQTSRLNSCGFFNPNLRKKTLAGIERKGTLQFRNVHGIWVEPKPFGWGQNRGGNGREGVKYRLLPLGRYYGPRHG